MDSKNLFENIFTQFNEANPDPIEAKKRLDAVIRFIRFHNPIDWNMETFNKTNFQYKFLSKSSWSHYKQKAKKYLHFDQEDLVTYYIVRLLNRNIYTIKAPSMPALKMKLLKMSKKI